MASAAISSDTQISNLIHKVLVSFSLCTQYLNTPTELRFLLQKVSYLEEAFNLTIIHHHEEQSEKFEKFYQDFGTELISTLRAVCRNVCNVFRFCFIVAIFTPLAPDFKESAIRKFLLLAVSQTNSGWTVWCTFSWIWWTQLFWHRGNFHRVHLVTALRPFQARLRANPPLREIDLPEQRLLDR